MFIPTDDVEGATPRRLPEHKVENRDDRDSGDARRREETDRPNRRLDPEAGGDVEPTDRVAIGDAQGHPLDNDHRGQRRQDGVDPQLRDRETVDETDNERAEEGDDDRAGCTERLLGDHRHHPCERQRGTHREVDVPADQDEAQPDDDEQVDRRLVEQAAHIDLGQEDRRDRRENDECECDQRINAVSLEEPENRPHHDRNLPRMRTSSATAAKMALPVTTI